MAIRLPLTLKVRAVRRSAEALQVESIVTDAKGESVGFVPLTMGPKTSAASACASLQHHVTGMAEAIRKTGKAEVPEVGDEEEDDQALVGREFSGSSL